jgi:ribose transport system substrate-binding protein
MLIAVVFMACLTASAGQYRFGYLVQDLGNQFWVTVAEGVKAGCAENGIEVTVLDARTDAARELANAEDLIQQKVDYILLSPWDPDSGSNVVEVANRAGIPVSVLDVGVTQGDIDTFIISDNLGGGEIAGQYVVDKLGKGAHEVAHIQCQLGYVITALRGQGFSEVVEKNGMKVVARQPADSQRSLGMTVMQNILQANPGIKAVFSENDEMALGALEAINAAGRGGDIIIVGFDGTDDAVASIKAGGLAGSVAQQPYEIGKMGVDMALKALAGEELPETIYVPVRLLTKDNL